MSDTSKIAKNLQAFRIALNAHDRENPTHNAYGIESSSDLTRAQYSEYTDRLQVRIDGGEDGNAPF